MLSRLAARPLSLTSTNSKTLLVCSTRFYWVLQTMGVTNKKRGGAVSETVPPFFVFIFIVSKQAIKQQNIWILENLYVFLWCIL